MTIDQIRALKLCCYAFYLRENRTGLNTFDSEAYAAAKNAVKLATGELYAEGTWWKDHWTPAEPY
jgi:hypothetical protein